MIYLQFVFEFFTDWSIQFWRRICGNAIGSGAGGYSTWVAQHV